MTGTSSLEELDDCEFPFVSNEELCVLEATTPCGQGLPFGAGGPTAEFALRAEVGLVLAILPTGIFAQHVGHVSGGRFDTLPGSYGLWLPAGCVLLAEEFQVGDLVHVSSAYSPLDTAERETELRAVSLVRGSRHSLIRLRAPESSFRHPELSKPVRRPTAMASTVSIPASGKATPTLMAVAVAKTVDSKPAVPVHSPRLVVNASLPEPEHWKTARSVFEASEDD